jgi:hypothetical protein
LSSFSRAFVAYNQQTLSQVIAEEAEELWHSVCHFVLHFCDFVFTSLVSIFLCYWLPRSILTVYMYCAEVDAISFDFSSNSSSLVSCEDFGVFCHGVWLIVCFFFYSVVSVPGRRGSDRLNQQTIRERLTSTVAGWQCCWGFCRCLLLSLKFGLHEGLHKSALPVKVAHTIIKSPVGNRKQFFSQR